MVGLVDEGSVRTSSPLPEPLADAARDVARALELAADWLNPGPTALLDFGLPTGFLGRCEIRRFDGLVVHLASRYDQVHFKLYAAVDQGPRSKHFDDLQRLEPTADELIAAAAWCQQHDPSEGFAGSLSAALDALGAGGVDERS
ncbi:hypothetical protein [Engelhardtia mirabilis]|uniref:hypothetical protein n=1 Tax=Engelhardtia mirabilis TaxID=2528011 RepID=UPI003AF340CB